MAVTVNNVRVTKTQLRAWDRAIQAGRRSFKEVEETELGTNGRGKTVKRLIERELVDA